MKREVLDDYIIWILNSIEVDADNMPSDKCIENLNKIVNKIWLDSTVEAFVQMGKVEQAEMDKETTFWDWSIEK